MKLCLALATLAILALGCGQEDNPANRARPTPEIPSTAAPAPDPATPLKTETEPLARPRPPSATVTRTARLTTPLLQPTQLALAAQPTPTATRTPRSPGMPLSPTPLALAGRITPTATPTPWPTPTQIPAEPQESSLAQAVTEELRARCLHYVREHEAGVTYAEVRELNPDNMTDLERTLWGDLTSDNDFQRYCRDYWSEPLSERNANKKNHSYREKCYVELYQDRDNAAQRGSNWIWDQQSRIANWLDIPGETLLSMSPSPLQLVMTVWQRDIRGKKLEPGDEWYGILDAWPKNRFHAGPDIGKNSYLDSCARYYPQLFTGRWIPLDTALTRLAMAETPVRTPTPMPNELRRWINQKDRPVLTDN